MKLNSIVLKSCVVVSCLTFVSIESFSRSFRPSQMPNGSVVNCAACHISQFGGGARTPFGQDVFARVSPGQRTVFWGPELAAIDSDGDGFTNGEELGDPNGTWVEGDPAPGDSSLVTNPGDPDSKPAQSGGDEPPFSVEDAGLTRLVDDTVIFNVGLDSLGNWEPYTSVVGTDVFLIESNTYAEGSTTDQRYAVAFQSADGGDPGFGEAFITDDGQPYTDSINFSRQNGNPGRVAGDKRPGAVNFIIGGESSLHSIDEFNTDSRWDDGVDRDFTARFGGVQVHQVDPGTLVQSPVSLAIDPVFGLGSANGFVAEVQMARFGGDIRGLDNGNFVVMVEDRSGLFSSSTAASAAVITPQGEVVVPGFLIADGSIWSNLAAYKGGFAARVGGVYYFYDNDGNLQGTADQALDLIPDTGRGDNTRIESHINSDFVFHAGYDGIDSVRIAVYDARTQELVADTNVNELTPDLGGTDNFDLLFFGLGRVEIGVDALNRIAVAWTAPGFAANDQIMARLLSFDAETLSFEYLTPTFFPFANSGFDSIARTRRPNVSVTTEAILIAGNGEINSGNDPLGDPDVPTESNFYTVIAHPDPQDDPTPEAVTAASDWPLY